MEKENIMSTAINYSAMNLKFATQEHLLLIILEKYSAFDVELKKIGMKNGWFCLEQAIKVLDHKHMKLTAQSKQRPQLVYLVYHKIKGFTYIGITGGVLSRYKNLFNATNRHRMKCESKEEMENLIIFAIQADRVIQIMNKLDIDWKKDWYLKNKSRVAETAIISLVVNNVAHDREPTNINQTEETLLSNMFWHQSSAVVKCLTN
jgi:hypothetical protein